MINVSSLLFGFPFLKRKRKKRKKKLQWCKISVSTLSSLINFTYRHGLKKCNKLIFNWFINPFLPISCNINTLPLPKCCIGQDRSEQRDMKVRQRTGHAGSWEQRQKMQGSKWLWPQAFLWGLAEFEASAECVRLITLSSEVWWHFSSYSRRWSDINTSNQNWHNQSQKRWWKERGRKNTIFRSDKYESNKNLREAEQTNVRAGRWGHIRTTALAN